MQQNLDRFKFKCWDKKINKFLPETGRPLDGWTFDVNYCMSIDALLERPEKYSERFTILQCTALKDKNGKLIYEGDILCVPPSYNFQGIKNVYIKWGDGCFGFYAKEFSEFRADTEIELFEIIGNIYENEELLENL